MHEAVIERLVSCRVGGPTRRPASQGWVATTLHDAQAEPEGNNAEASCSGLPPEYRPSRLLLFPKSIVVRQSTLGGFAAHFVKATARTSQHHFSTVVADAPRSNLRRFGKAQAHDKAEPTLSRDTAWEKHCLGVFRPSCPGVTRGFCSTGFAGRVRGEFRAPWSVSQVLACPAPRPATVQRQISGTPRCSRDNMHTLHRNVQRQHFATPATETTHGKGRCCPAARDWPGGAAVERQGRWDLDPHPRARAACKAGRRACRKCMGRRPCPSAVRTKGSCANAVRHAQRETRLVLQHYGGSLNTGILPTTPRASCGPHRPHLGWAYNEFEPASTAFGRQNRRKVWFEPESTESGPLSMNF